MNTKIIVPVAALAATMATAAYSQTRTAPAPATGFSRPLPGMVRPYPQQPILIGPGGINNQFIPGVNGGFVGTFPQQPGFVGGRPTQPGFVGTQPTQPGFVGATPFMRTQAAAARARVAVPGNDPTGRSGFWGNTPTDPGVVFVPGQGYVSARNATMLHLAPQQANGAFAGTTNGTANGTAGAFNGGVNGNANFNGTANGNFNGAVNGNFNGAANGNFNGAFQNGGGAGQGRRTNRAHRAARVINNGGASFGTNVTGVRGNNFRTTRPSVAQARVVDHAQELMQRQPFREGQVMDLDRNSVLVRYSLNGEVRTERVPLSQVFYFGANGQLSTASTAPGTVQLGTRVMFPARR